MGNLLTHPSQLKYDTYRFYCYDTLFKMLTTTPGEICFVDLKSMNAYQLILHALSKNGLALRGLNIFTTTNLHHPMDGTTVIPNKLLLRGYSYPCDLELDDL